MPNCSLLDSKSAAAEIVRCGQGRPSLQPHCLGHPWKNVLLYSWHALHLLYWLLVSWPVTMRACARKVTHRWASWNVPSSLCLHTLQQKTDTWLDSGLDVADGAACRSAEPTVAAAMHSLNRAVTNRAAGSFVSPLMTAVTEGCAPMMSRAAMQLAALVQSAMLAAPLPTQQEY